MLINFNPEGPLEELREHVIGALKGLGELSANPTYIQLQLLVSTGDEKVVRDVARDLLALAEHFGTRVH